MLVIAVSLVVGASAFHASERNQKIRDAELIDALMNPEKDWDSTAERLLAEGANPSATMANLGDHRPWWDTLTPRFGTTKSINPTALMLAVQSGNHNVIRSLLQHGANANSTDVNGETALFWVPGDDPDLARMLADAGADVNAKTMDGVTPLMLAARFGRPRIVRMLLSRGAQVAVRDSHGKDAVDYARDGYHYVADKQNKQRMPQFEEVIAALDSRSQR